MSFFSSTEAACWLKSCWLAAAHLSTSANNRWNMCSFQLSSRLLQIRGVISPSWRVFSSQLCSLLPSSKKKSITLKTDKSWEWAQWEAGIGGCHEVIESWLQPSADDSFPLARICCSAVFMQRLCDHGSHSWCLHLCSSVDLGRINLPHQWGNPGRCDEFWEDWETLSGVSGLVHSSALWWLNRQRIIWQAERALLWWD